MMDSFEFPNWISLPLVGLDGRGRSARDAREHWASSRNGSGQQTRDKIMKGVRSHDGVSFLSNPRDEGWGGNTKKFDFRFSLIFIFLSHLVPSLNKLKQLSSRFFVWQISGFPCVTSNNGGAIYWSNRERTANLFFGWELLMFTVSQCWPSSGWWWEAQVWRPWTWASGVRCEG
jgi:hypothetical protein